MNIFLEKPLKNYLSKFNGLQPWNFDLSEKY